MDGIIPRNTLCLNAEQVVETEAYSTPYGKGPENGALVAVDSGWRRGCAEGLAEARPGSWSVNSGREFRP